MVNNAKTIQGNRDVEVKGTNPHRNFVIVQSKSFLFFSLLLLFLKCWFISTWESGRTSGMRCGLTWRSYGGQIIGSPYIATIPDWKNGIALWTLHACIILTGEHSTSLWCECKIKNWKAFYSECALRDERERNILGQFNFFCKWNCKFRCKVSKARITKGHRNIASWWRAIFRNLWIVWWSNMNNQYVSLIFWKGFLKETDNLCLTKAAWSVLCQIFQVKSLRGFIKPSGKLQSLALPHSEHHFFLRGE